MRLGLIGLGRWGSNYLDNLLKIKAIEFIHVAASKKQFEDKKECNVQFTEDWREVCNDSRINGLIIAVSPESQYEVTKYALKIGVPLLVEKPFTLNKNHAHELISLSKISNVLCMVGYTHIYSKGYQDLKLSVEKSGGIRNIYSEGISRGPYRTNTPILWDWGCHDIAMCIDLIKEKPRSATVKTIYEDPTNIFSRLLEINMVFSSKIIARCIVGNASEYKRRDFCVICDDGTFIYDGLSAGLSKQYSNKVYSSDFDRFKQQITPLECVLNEFITAIENQTKYHYTIDLASNVNETLDKIKLI
jgi:predicted dehydrogenase